MGNKLESKNQSESSQSISEANWVISVEKELHKLSDFMPKISVRQDNFQKQSVLQLFSLHKQRLPSIKVQSDTLFLSLYEDMRSRRRIDLHFKFKNTHLVRDSDIESSPLEEEILEILSRKEGFLEDILKAFYLTKLPSNSTDSDKMIMRFIDAYVMILVHYYNLHEFAKKMDTPFLNKSALKNLVTNIVFTDELMDAVYQCRRKEQFQINEQIHLRMMQSNDYSLQDCGISIKYCLNESTKNYILSKQSSKQKSSELTDISNHDYAPIIVESVDREILPSRPNTRIIQPTFFRDNPYQDSIEALNSIQFRRTPYHKLLALKLCFQAIYMTIREYYEQFTSEPSILSTDELILIFRYVLSRSKLINPYTHWDIMEKYCGNMDGVEGYYLTIMLSCLKVM